MPFLPLSSPPTFFPTYLSQSPPFRRKSSVGSATSPTDSSSSPWSRSASISSTTSTDSNTTSTSPLLSGHISHLRCARCASDLALSSQIISKGFTGRHGRAYLVAPSTSAISSNPSHLSTPKAKNDALPNLPNTFTHKPVPRQLVTGAHTVGDISCAMCGSVLGWKYVAAEEPAQRYKVGKFILETKRVCRTATWEEDGEDGGGLYECGRRVGRKASTGSVLPPNEMPGVVEEEEIEFDSQDESECEDLFMGVWTPQLAVKRRRERQFAGGED